LSFNIKKNFLFIKKNKKSSEIRKILIAETDAPTMIDNGISEVKIKIELLVKFFLNIYKKLNNSSPIR